MATPMLHAAFELSHEREPISYYVQGRKHYALKIFLVNAPPDTLSATYQLHPSYTNPVREVPRGVLNFQEELTTYGDYDVYVTIRATSTAPISFVTRLSDALKAYYSDGATAVIQEAIEHIKGR